MYAGIKIYTMPSPSSAYSHSEILQNLKVMEEEKLGTILGSEIATSLALSSRILPFNSKGFKAKSKVKC